MPAIRGQSFEIVDDLNATVMLETSGFGVLVITVQRAGTGAQTTITFNLTRDGVQVINQQLANPTVAVCEQWVSDQVAAIVGQGLQFRIHFFSVNPTMMAQIGCFNGDVVIPPNWWSP